MKRYILLYVAILLMFIGIHHSYAWDIKAKNTTDKTLYYELIWMDCDWWPDKKIRPCNMGMAELKPGQTFEQKNRPVGKFIILWSQPHALKTIEGEFKEVIQAREITEEKGLLLVFPDAPPEFLPGT
jgi:hypothetical protein